MKINTKKLLKAAEQGKKIIAGNSNNTISVNPVLGTLLLSSNGYTLNLRATNSAITYTVDLESLINTGAPWSVCVNAGALFKILKVVKFDFITLTPDENNTLSVKTEKTTYTLPTIDTEFPAALIDPADKWDYLTLINSDDLKKLNMATDSSSSTSILTGINYNFNTGKFAATDGNRMIVFQGNKSALHDREVNIFAEVVKSLPASTDFEIHATCDNKIKLTAGNETFYIVNMEGQFPVYAPFIPCHNVDVMSFDSKELAASLAEIEITLDPMTSMIKFEFDKKEQVIFLSSYSPDLGETKTRLTTICSDISKINYFEIAFNHRYIKDFLKLGKRINFKLGSDNLCGAKLTFNNGYTGVLMPIQTVQNNPE